MGAYVGEYVIIYLVAFTLSVFLVPMVRTLALRLGAVDEPDGIRKIHTEAVPRMGGVAIFIAFVVPVVGVYVLGATGVRGSWAYTALAANPTALAGLLGASLLILLLGVYDDLYHARPRVKVLFQVIAALILCYVGIQFSAVANPFGEGKITFWEPVAWALTIFWILAITNAINLIDGMDGLGPGVGLFVAGTLFVISLFLEVPLVSAVTAALVGAMIGFLIFNFHPAKMFMGDSGSLFVGFLLAAMAMQGSVKRHIMVPIIALALPIVDTLLAILRRWSRGLPMSVPDKLHVHHRLMKMGFSQREAVLVLYAISGILGCSALVIAVSNNVWAFWIASGTIVAILAVSVNLLGAREFVAAPALIAQAVRRRRRRGKAWVNVYTAAARMENVATLDELWASVERLLLELDLDTAHVRLEDDVDGKRSFDWVRSGTSPSIDAEGTMQQGWTARLPLLDGDRVLGSLVLGKDTRRGPLPDALGGMADVLCQEIVKTLERLDVSDER